MEVFTERKSWSDAQAACVVWGGQLAKITSAQEQRFAESLAQGESLWIGLSDAQSEGQWQWTDGTALDSSVFSNLNRSLHFGYQTVWANKDTHINLDTC